MQATKGEQMQQKAKWKRSSKNAKPEADNRLKLMKILVKSLEKNIRNNVAPKNIGNEEKFFEQVQALNKNHRQPVSKLKND